MIAVDTNILVYAHRADMPQHEVAFPMLAGLVEGNVPWALPWPCVHEFFASVTSTKWKVPTTPSRALTVLNEITNSPRVQIIGEGVDHLEILTGLVESAGVRGGSIHDARIAAICIAHGVNKLLTADRDFSRFPTLKTHNPFIQTHDRRRH
ncbi:MAG: TA system VapC family ribonuclease toxin [Rudaea sp.]